MASLVKGLPHKFNHWNPHKDGRREPTPQNYHLTPYICYATYIHIYTSFVCTQTCTIIMIMVTIIMIIIIINLRFFNPEEKNSLVTVYKQFILRWRLTVLFSRS